MTDDNIFHTSAELPSQFQLEQRLMFDGAAVGTTVDAVSDTAAQSQSSADTDAKEADSLFDPPEAHPALAVATDEATRKIREFVQNASLEDLFTIFNGGLSEIDGQWQLAMEAEIQRILDGEPPVQIVVLDSETMLLAKAGFAENGPDGTPVIYLNESLLAEGDSDEIVAILVEEYGHLIDARVNVDNDTQGDEGQGFASIVTGDEAASRAIEDDHGILLIDGQYVEVERATFTFVNAYEVDGSRTPTGKESNSHDYVDTSLGAPTVDDNNFNVTEFSGNDVSAAAINIDGMTYYGWISRPIKSGGIVRGFYFWTDADFVDLATAQADGNTDGDRDVSDNRAFVLVVDQAWFDAQPEVETGIKNIGSSSDRVDSAFNALLASNTAPTASPDTGTATEDGGVSNATPGVDATGNVLTNDNDVDAGDSITVTYVGTTSANQSVPGSGTVDVVGQFGTLTIAADGSYTYTVTSNSNALVEALRTSSDTLVDSFTYSIADEDGVAATTTLEITIEGVNDNPVAADDYNTAKESLRTDNTAYDNTDPLGVTAVGNVLTNDSDVDGNGEVLSIGALEGTIQIDNVTNDPGDIELIFYGESGFNSVSTGQTLYYNDNGTYRAVHASNGDLITVSADPTQDPDVTTTYYVPLSDTPAYYLDAGSNQVPIGNLDGLAVGFKSATSETTNTASMKTATSATSQTPGTATIDLTPSNSTGVIAVGMTVSGAGIPAGTLVTDITYDGSGQVISLELDKVVTASAGETLSFSAASGTTISGEYGELILNSDGSYVYTPYANNTNLGAGESGNDSFDYTVLDLVGATHTATLNITVYGSSASDPNAVADTATATEAGGVANGTAGSTPTGNVLGNDTTPSGTNVVDAARSMQDASATTVGTDTVITGQYGTLTISADGSWTYAVNNSDPAVDALRTTADTLEDVFVYTVKNGQTGAGGDLLDSDTLTVTIQGANDNPVATNDAATAIEAGGFNNVVAGYNPSGNVLSNDADVDDPASALAVTAIRVGAVEGAGSAGTIGSALVGTYGTLTMNSNGSWSYAVDNTSTTVNDLAVGETLTESFNYTVTDGSGGGLGDVAVLNITIEGAVDTVAVNNIYVNEASDYAVFTVSGAAGIAVELSLSDTTGLPAGDAKATLGTDTAASNTLEYYNGTSWVAYNAGSPPVMPVGGELFVRIAVTQDTVHEGNESFTLVAVTSDGSQSTGIGTIGDEGEGDIFLSSNVTGTPNGSGDSGYPTLDDDRPTISITDDTVDEGDTTEFTVSIDKTSVFDVSFSPTLNNGTATIGDDTDASTALEVSTDGGSNWTIVSGPVTIAAGQTSIMLRLDTTDDSDVEGTEAFTLSTGAVSGPVINPAGVTATATINDNDFANQAPVAEDNGYTTNEDTDLTGKNIILDADTGTDSDPDNDALQLEEVNGTTWASLSASSDAGHPSIDGWKMVSLSNGTVYLKSDGSMDYEPDADFHGADSFTYKVSDGALASVSAATVTITVGSVDDAPLIGGDTSGSGSEDTTLSGTLSATDADGMSDGSYYTVTTSAINGTASIDPETGEWSYEPNADYYGSDSFTVTITDDEDHTTTQEISVTVTPVADIADDADDVDEDDAVTTNVLSNDSFEGTPVVTSITQGTHGTVAIVDGSAGTVSYTPDEDFHGEDTYTYTVTSGGVTETATVTITVEATPLTSPTVLPGDIVSPEEEPEKYLLQGPVHFIETALTEPAYTDELMLNFVDLVVQRNIPLQSFAAVQGNVVVDFLIPADTFNFIGDIDESNTITLSAIMLDGSALPDWLVFDANTGRFHGTAPEGFEGTLNIRIVAFDGEGRQVDTIVTINIDATGIASGEGDAEDKVSLDTESKGKVSFLDQLEKNNRPGKAVPEQIAEAASWLGAASKAS